jgi:hypothetical protein
MGEKLIIGPINKGLKTDREPFVIDNDSFPQMINAYQWRGQVKRKRGTEQLNRLQKQVAIALVLNLNTGQDAILPNLPVVPGSINIVGSGDGTTFKDTNADGILIATGGTGVNGTVNYLTGDIHIPAGDGQTMNGIFSFFPNLPVMGLEDLNLNATQFPGTIAFDTSFSYNVPTTSPYTPYDITYYKNPGADAVNLPGYTPKATQTHFSWNGESYQQFWTTNYQGAFWATNGIQVPFRTTNIGMQYNAISGFTIVTNGNGTTVPAVANITIVGHGLVPGDFLFINEVNGISGINDQTGYVITVTDENTVVVEFPKATLGGAYTNGGIAQYLTNVSDAAVDTIRWYDGDPTNGTGLPSASTLGWVNFSPPLSFLNYSIAELPPRIYYLVGARMIVPFKDRLLFIGVVVQNSDAGSQIYLPDTVVYSQNGTPYYTASWTDPSTNYGINPTIPYNQILVPQNQTATPFSYFADNTGFGGFVSAGTSQPITTEGPNEDALILGFSGSQVRFIYTGNDIIPFQFYLINSELGSASTFSTVIMDQGVLTRGTRGFVMTNQTSAQRFDTEILPQAFQISQLNNGNERFCSQRDFIDEWIYFTYLTNQQDTNPNNVKTYIFPNQTLQYNYRDQSWGVFNETYTTYGQFRKQTGDTWLTIKQAWQDWNEPWDDGETTLFQPVVIAGNQQGFIMIRNQGTGEDYSLFIQSIAGSVITSPDHGLNNGDYIVINNALGNIGAQINGKIFQIFGATENTFVLNPGLNPGTYTGAGLIKRLYVPFIQSKQFPTAWELGRKTRIGVQQYLFEKTSFGKVQLLLYISQNGTNAFNNNSFVPQDETIYSTTLFTCPESTNLGLTPANTNLNLPTASLQKQIWHRINTSLIGDTVQFGITLSDAQMRQFMPTTITYPITTITQAYPAVLTSNNSLEAGQMIQISGVLGMTQINNLPTLNNAVYQVISATTTTVTLNVDTTTFSAYTSGGIITIMDMPNQETEIIFHAATLDLSPSSLLV